VKPDEGSHLLEPWASKMLKPITQRVNTRPLDEFLNDPINARILRRSADRAIERFEDPEPSEGLCPYCGIEPAKRRGEPCVKCREQIEDESDRHDAERIIKRLEHKFAHQAHQRTF